MNIPEALLEDADPKKVARTLRDLIKEEDRMEKRRLAKLAKQKGN